jgi:hypothetical protein
LSQPDPAAFTVSGLVIQPAEVEPEETVTVRVTVANTGGTRGSYTVSLEINDEPEEEKSVTVSAGSSKYVDFEISRQEAGDYNVGVEGLEDVFTVREIEQQLPAEEEQPEEEIEPEPEDNGVNWYIVGVVIIAVILLAVTVVVWYGKRRAE